MVGAKGGTVSPALLFSAVLVPRVNQFFTFLIFFSRTALRVAVHGLTRLARVGLAQRPGAVRAVGNVIFKKESSPGSDGIAIIVNGDHISYWISILT